MFVKILLCIFSFLVISCASNQDATNREPAADKNICTQNEFERKESYQNKKLFPGDILIYESEVKSKALKTPLSFFSSERSGNRSGDSYPQKNAEIFFDIPKGKYLELPKTFKLEVIEMAEGIVTLESPSGKRHKLRCYNYIKGGYKLDGAKVGTQLSEKCLNSHVSPRSNNLGAKLYKEMPSEFPCKNWLKPEPVKFNPEKNSESLGVDI